MTSDKFILATKSEQKDTWPKTGLWEKETHADGKKLWTVVIKVKQTKIIPDAKAEKISLMVWMLQMEQDL